MIDPVYVQVGIYTHGKLLTIVYVYKNGCVLFSKSKYNPKETKGFIIKWKFLNDVLKLWDGNAWPRKSNGALNRANGSLLPIMNQHFDAAL